MILRKQPLKVSRRYVMRWLPPAVAFLVFGLSFVALGTWYPAEDAAEILADRQVWASGAPAPSARVAVEAKTSSLVFHDVKFHISFVDGRGVARKVTRPCDTLFLRPNTSGAPAVRFDPASPTLAAVSWAQSAALGRWMRVAVLFGLVALVVGPQIALHSAKVALDLTDAVACGRLPHEVELAVLSEDVITVKGVRMKRYKYSGRSPWGHELSGYAVDDPFLGAPLFLDNGKTRILALASEHTGSRAVVIRDNLMPYECDAQRARGIRDALIRVRQEREAAAARFG